MLRWDVQSQHLSEVYLLLSKQNSFKKPNVVLAFITEIFYKNRFIFLKVFFLGGYQVYLWVPL